MKILQKKLNEVESQLKEELQKLHDREEVNISRFYVPEILFYTKGSQ
jgi:hypothetical protein